MIIAALELLGMRDGDVVGIVFVSSKSQMDPGDIESLHTSDLKSKSS